MSNPAKRYLVTVCQHRSCVRNGSEDVLAAFQRHPSAPVMVSSCECQGQCGSGPTVKVMPDNTWYCQVTPDDVDEIIETHLQPDGHPVERLLNPRIHQSQSTYANLAAQYQAFIQQDME